MSKNILEIVYDLLKNSSLGELDILENKVPLIWFDETILEVALMDKFPNKKEFVDMFLTDDMDNWEKVSKSLKEQLLYMVYDQLKEREVFYRAVFTKNSFKLIQELMGLEKKINMDELEQNNTKFNAWVKTWLPNTKKKFIEKFRQKIKTKSRINKWYKLKNMMQHYKVEMEEKFEQELNNLLDMVYDHVKERDVIYRAIFTKNSYSFKLFQELMGLEINTDEFMEMDEKEFDDWVNTWLPNTKEKFIEKFRPKIKTESHVKKWYKLKNLMHNYKVEVEQIKFVKEYKNDLQDNIFKFMPENPDIKKIEKLAHKLSELPDPDLVQDKFADLNKDYRTALADAADTLSENIKGNPHWSIVDVESRSNSMNLTRQKINSIIDTLNSIAEYIEHGFGPPPTKKTKNPTFHNFTKEDVKIESEGGTIKWKYRKGKQFKIVPRLKRNELLEDERIRNELKLAEAKAKNYKMKQKQKPKVLNNETFQYCKDSAYQNVMRRIETKLQKHSGNLKEVAGDDTDMYFTKQLQKEFSKCIKKNNDSTKNK